MAFILTLVIHTNTAKTDISFLFLEILGSYLMSFFIAVLTSDLIKVLLNVFFLIKIVCCINFRGQNIRIINIGVFLIMFFLSSLFFLLFPNFVGAFYTSRNICKLRLLDFYFKLFDLRVFRVVSLIKAYMH